MATPTEIGNRNLVASCGVPQILKKNVGRNGVSEGTVFGSDFKDVLIQDWQFVSLNMEAWLIK